MTLTVATPTQLAVGPSTATLVSTGASGGTAPYGYQWHKSLVSGFTPGPGTAIAGATALTADVAGLIPGTRYYFKLVATDDAATPDTGTSSQLEVVTQAPTQSPNQFAQAPYIGMIDMRFPYNTISAQVSNTESGTIRAGQAVKMVTSELTGVPKVVACDANNDQVYGFVNYDIKSKGFTKDEPLEMSMEGNVMFLYATGAIPRGARVSLDVSTVGGVRNASGNTGDRIVGWALDGAANPGQLVRIFLKTPSFQVV